MADDKSLEVGDDHLSLYSLEGPSGDLKKGTKETSGRRLRNDSTSSDSSEPSLKKAKISLLEEQTVCLDSLAAKESDDHHFVGPSDDHYDGSPSSREQNKENIPPETEPEIDLDLRLFDPDIEYIIQDNANQEELDLVRFVAQIEDSENYDNYWQSSAEDSATSSEPIYYRDSDNDDDDNDDDDEKSPQKPSPRRRLNFTLNESSPLKPEE